MRYTLGFEGHGSSMRRKISQQGRHRNHSQRGKESIEPVKKAQDGWKKADQGRGDWSVMVLLAQWLRRVLSEADLLSGQPLVTLTCRSTIETMPSQVERLSGLRKWKQPRTYF